LPLYRITKAEMEADPFERWSDIPGFPGYRVSTKGRVVSVLKGRGRLGGRTFDNEAKLLRPTRDKRGYHIYGLYFENGKYRNMKGHRLVLLAFVGPCPEGEEACHCDGDPENNDLDNLRWDTHRNNSQDAIRHGRVRRGSASGRSKLDEADVRIIRDLYGSGALLRDLAMRFGVSSNTIADACKRHTWRHVPIDPPAEASA
jgi:hypothetical protein